MSSCELHQGAFELFFRQRQRSGVQQPKNPSPRRMPSSSLTITTFSQHTWRIFRKVIPELAL